MTSATNFNCLPNNATLAELLWCLPSIGGRLPTATGLLQQTVNITLKETLAGLQSSDLEAIATVLRNVVGQIDTLLLERQLAECGFDAVLASAHEAKPISF